MSVTDELKLFSKVLDARKTASGAVLARIESSVVRPLTSLVDRPAEVIPETALPNADGRAETSGDVLWELAQQATSVYQAVRSSELFEAAAALQDLACRAADSDAVAQGRLNQLKTMIGDEPVVIRLSPNGPLLVKNVVRFVNWLGEPLPCRPLMALCRCGASATKPYCDGSHAKIEFNDAKDPGRLPDRCDTYVGEQVAILDNRATCQHSGSCTDRLPNVFHAKTEPFVTPSGGRMDEIVRAVRDCPSGALSFAVDGVKARDLVDHHHTRPPTIEVTKDGPYRITGGIALEEADGSDMSRNEGASREHFALCRCGHSRNKPFCTGMHWYVEFRDPVGPVDAKPTIYEWAGGLPALIRMTRIFYEKYVPADDLLAPLFANMSPDHPERVAKWLAEVFCGPHYYSEQYGGTRACSHSISGNA